MWKMLELSECIWNWRENNFLSFLQVRKVLMMLCFYSLRFHAILTRLINPIGKDSIRYYNEVPVEKRVFKNLQLFMENKSPGDDLFDRLNTTVMNKHLNELMEGLTAKVFRTYNASWTLQQQLDKLTDPDETEAEKILSYNRANRAVAILCNHQRSVPKTHAKSMENLKAKIEAKKEAIAEAELQTKDAKRDAKHGSVKEKVYVIDSAIKKTKLNVMLIVFMLFLLTSMLIVCVIFTEHTKRRRSSWND